MALLVPVAYVLFMPPKFPDQVWRADRAATKDVYLEPDGRRAGFAFAAFLDDVAVVEGFRWDSLAALSKSLREARFHGTVFYERQPREFVERGACTWVRYDLAR